MINLYCFNLHVPTLHQVAKSHENKKMEHFPQVDIRSYMFESQYSTPRPAKPASHAI